MKKKGIYCVIGLGYVGLPIAVELAKKNNVIGFDLNKERIRELRSGLDKTKEVKKQTLKNLSKLFLTHDKTEIKSATTYLITVPTPINKKKLPDLKSLKNACEIVGKCLSKENIVIFESTVFPGCTREYCIPILEKHSKLKFNIEFFVGYSPERINPGDASHSLRKIPKVVSGSNTKTTNIIYKMYKQIINANIHKASSIEVAEAAKVIENVQRDLNIALMNELSMLFEKMHIDTAEVIKAAKTKWNFAEFYPGLVGGHCIGVDPYYLTYKSSTLGFNPKIILAGRQINEGMVSFVTKKIVSLLKKKFFNISKLKIGVLGCTFKENVPDIRNSKVFDLINNLNKFGLKIMVCDPVANKKLVLKSQQVKLQKINELYGKIDLLIIAVPHSQFKNLKISSYNKLFRGQRVVFDFRGILDTKLVKKYNYEIHRL